MKTELTQNELKRLLHYDPQCGVFTWITGPANRRDLDGSVTAKKGKRPRVRINDTLYRASRLAWFYMTGEWPNGLVDHKDGNPSNNQWMNLRIATATINTQNQRRAHTDNKTGLLGVHPKRNKFTAQITAGDRRVTLGSFATPKEAHVAYITAKRMIHEGCTI